MKILYLLSVVVILFSCNLGALKIDPEIFKGMEEAASVYGGVINVTKGFKKSSDKNNSGSYLEFTINGSNILNNLGHNRSSAVAGLAYTIFKPAKNVIKAKQLSVIIDSSNTEYEFEYPVSMLRSLDSLMPKIDSIHGYFKAGQHDKVVGMMRVAETRAAKDLPERLVLAEEKCGPVKEISFMGFYIFQEPESGNRDILEIISFVNREKQSHWLHTFIDVSDTGHELVGLKIRD